MRPLVLVVSLLAGLSLVSTASAKELAGATVCGVDACRSASADQLERMVPEGDAAAAPDAPAPFLRVSLKFRGEEDEVVTVGSVLVPSAHLMGGEGGWTWLAPAALARLEDLAAGLEPWPAAQLSSAVQELGGAPIEAAAPEPAASAPPPVDRSSPTGVVVGLGALVVLLGVAAVVRDRRHGGGGALAG